MNRVEALAACARITRSEARNFYYGLKLLPAREARALYAVYAWMRVLDDLADDPARSAESRHAELERFGRSTHAVLAGVVSWNGSIESQRFEGADPREHAVLAGLSYVVSEHAIDAGDIAGAVEGQRMDLEPRVYASWEETRLYCDRVAGTVGRVCLDVWGVRAGADAAIAREFSTTRGIAFQIVNILRDLREDHGRGRCYLPADELRAGGITVEDLIAWRDDARCARFMQVQCARAERLFAETAPLEGMVSPAAVPTLAAMSEIYRRILRRIARDPRRALAERVRLSGFEKFS
ncbi:MAG: phytoene/squalene synthase family protein, partial [Phycisphaerales bacterium]